MPSDDDLVLLALNAHDEPHQYHETLRGMNPSYLDGWRRAVRAVREAVAELRPAALCPDVAPLEAGETVTVPAVYGAAELRESYGCLLLELPADPSQNVIAARRVLNAAGVATLIETCRRWLAAQEGQNCPERDERFSHE